MTPRRIRTAKQARDCREVALWAINDRELWKSFDFDSVYKHELARDKAQAFLAKRAEMKRGES